MFDSCNFLNPFDRESKQMFAGWRELEWRFDSDESRRNYYSRSKTNYYSTDDWNRTRHYESAQVESSMAEEYVVDDDDDDDDGMVVDSCRESVELLLEWN